MLKNDVYPRFVRSIHNQNEPIKNNFESILYEHVGYFKLIIFRFETSCIIWMI
jgi:hypothetical protein